MTTVRAASLSDLAFIDDLRASEWYQVGFIPRSRYESEIQGHSGGSVLVVEEAGEPCGFLYATHGPMLTNVTQIAVCADIRRVEKGQALIARLHDIADRRGKVGLRCRVACDIEANEFWQALGFKRVGESMGSFLGKPSGPKSRLLAVYERLSVPRLIPDRGQL